MDKIKQIMNNRPSKNMGCDISPRAFEKWNPAVNASDSGKNTISVLDVIGEDFWGEGVTAKRVAAALRSIGDNNDVEVIINSPGGDLFEGLAIYSLLKEHKGNVTVKVLSLAASAASIIAMAGDEIKIARAGFFMVHNTWVFGIGNRHDLREIADWLEPFDAAMADIYQSQTGMDAEKIVSMLDNETWIGGTAAIEQGFADSYLDSDEIKEDNKNNAKFSAQKLDLIMAKSGIPRSERRKLIADIKGSTQNATDTQNAVTFNEPLVKLTFDHKLEV